MRISKSVTILIIITIIIKTAGLLTEMLVLMLLRACIDFKKSIFL